MAEEKTTPEEQEYDGTEFYMSSNEEYIAACYNAIAAVDMIDTMNRKDKEVKANILQRCLRIIDECTGAMYDEIFDDRAENE